MMLWLWFAIGLVLLAGGLVVALAIYDDYSMVFFVPGVVSQHYDRVSCHTFSVNTGRRTKFVHYTAYSWDCLTPTKGGKWIPTSNLREFGAQP